MADESCVRPRLTLLSEAQIAAIHARSVQLLSSTGVRVDSETARRLLASATGRRADDQHRLRIPPDLIEWALLAAPSVVDVYDRRGALAFRLGNASTRFGIGVTTLYYQDPATDAILPFSRQHMKTLARLGDALPSFDVISTIGFPHDVPPHSSDLFAALDMYTNTTKPLVLLVADEEQFHDVLDLLEHLHGDLATRASVLPYVNPISPLVLNAATTDKMLATAKRGLPLIFSNYGMAGATTPLLPIGALVLLNAELLAGLVFAQLARKGAPVILGSLPAYFDMQTMVSFYDPTSYLLNLACAEMMAHYRLPHCGTSGSGIGWGPDLVASGHQWINHLLCCIGRVGLAPFVGDVLGSKAFSPALLVYADEVIAQARRFARGFSLQGIDDALSEAATVGPAGSFLTADSTLAGFRDAYFKSRFFENLSLDTWQHQGSPQAGTRLREHTMHLLAELKMPPDSAQIAARGQAFIDALTKG
jgi:trimethylamine--corrinoid protein Co-methyltransferase